MTTVIYNFARSGGTLLNKCLASMPNVVMLSEVSRFGGGYGERGKESPTTVQQQAEQWYDIRLTSSGFEDGILELHKYCQENNKHLIIRDWSYINFFKNESYNNEPELELGVYHKIPGLAFNHIAFVRDAIDVWISRGMPSVDEFFKKYLLYVNQIKVLGTRIFKYEEFCESPEKSLKDICEYIGVEYRDVLPEALSYQKVNGDTQNNPKLGQNNKVRRLPRKIIGKERIVRLNNCRAMVACNSVMGYPTTYKIGKFTDKIQTINTKMDHIYFGLKSRLGLYKQIGPKVNPTNEIWKALDGDKSLRVEYNLNPNSVVFDCGGYKGDWASEIFARYQSKVHIFEPFPEFAKQIKHRFKQNDSIFANSFGLGAKNSNQFVVNNENSTSLFGNSALQGESVQIYIKNVKDYLVENDIDYVDLIKINIEGAEYELLDYLLKENIIGVFRNLQIQFHKQYSNDHEIRAVDIRERLSNTHNLTWSYSFVWENWEIKR